MTGRTLGRYQLGERLGRGGMGEVWRARDPALRRDVAVKVLRRDGDDGQTLRDDFVQRFLREARAAASLKHPNVVAIHDVGVDEEPYIVMEWVEGASLRGFIGTASVPVAQRIEWLVEIARALAAAHEIGLVHRDIKPDNVMITKDGHAKVLDFGIAKAVGTSDEAPLSQKEAPESFRTQQGRIVGTPKYMAPEQLRGDAIDARVDQWAWACVAYELLTGSMPDRDEIPQPISLTMPEVPFDVAAAIVRARSQDPAKRFDSMRALLAAFAVQPSGEVTVSVASGRRDPDAPTTTGPVRRAWPRIAFVALTSFAAAGAVVFAWSRHRAPPLAPKAPATPACSFTMLPDTPLGVLPTHFFSSQAIVGGVMLGIVRVHEQADMEQLVTITPDAVTSRTPPLPPEIPDTPTSLFVLATPNEARHYLVYNKGADGPLVVGRSVSNDALVDITRLRGSEDFHTTEISAFYSSHVKPPALTFLAVGKDVDIHTTARPTLRLFGRGVFGDKIYEASSSEPLRGLVAISSGHHVAYTFIAANALYVGSFAIEGHVEERPGPFDTKQRFEVSRVADQHVPVALGDSSSHPGRAFEGEVFHVVWSELGHPRFRHAALATDQADASPIVDEAFDAPTDGSAPDLRIEGGVSSLAWHDGAHVYYGEGASVLVAASRAVALPDDAVSSGPFIAFGTSKLVTWVSGPNNVVRRAIVSCR